MLFRFPDCVFLFLFGPESVFIRGQTLDINGGHYMG